MPAEPLPHFRRGAGDPTLPTGEVGVRIATPGLEGSPPEPENPPGHFRWRLDGAFRVPRAPAGPSSAGPEMVLRRIVLAMTFGSTHDVQARHAFRDELVFPEDVRDLGDLVEGTFHVDLLRTFDFIAPIDTYFITASIGPYVSEVVRREAHLLWLVPHPTTGQAEPDEPDEDDVAADEPEPEDHGNWEVDDPF